MKKQPDIVNESEEYGGDAMLVEEEMGIEDMDLKSIEIITDLPMKRSLNLTSDDGWVDSRAATERGLQAD